MSVSIVSMALCKPVSARQHFSWILPRIGNYAKNMDNLSLLKVLEGFNAPLNEEQAWAVCFQCAKFLQEAPPERRCSFNDVRCVILSKDGSVEVQPESKGELGPLKEMLEISHIEQCWIAKWTQIWETYRPSIVTMGYKLKLNHALWMMSEVFKSLRAPSKILRNFPSLWSLINLLYSVCKLQWSRSNTWVLQAYSLKGNCLDIMVNMVLKSLWPLLILCLGQVLKMIFKLQ